MGGSCVGVCWGMSVPPGVGCNVAQDVVQCASAPLACAPFAHGKAACMGLSQERQQYVQRCVHGCAPKLCLAMFRVWSCASSTQRRHAAPSRLHHAAAVLLPAVAVTACWIPLDGGTRGQHAADGWRWLMHTSSSPSAQATASPGGLPHPPDTTRRLCAPGWSLQWRWGPPAGAASRPAGARVAHHGAAAGLCVISPAPTTAVHEGARWHAGHAAAGRMEDMLACMWQSFPCLCCGSPSCAGLDGCEGVSARGAAPERW